MAIQETFQRKSKYLDFDLNFTKHPLTNDLVMKKGAAAINQSLKNIVQTAFYERPLILLSVQMRELYSLNQLIVSPYKI